MRWDDPVPSYRGERWGQADSERVWRLARQTSPPTVPTPQRPSLCALLIVAAAFCVFVAAVLGILAIAAWWVVSRA